MSLLALLLLAAQHQHHETPAPEPAPACSPEHAAMGHCTLPEPKVPPAPTPPPAAPPAPSCTPEHAAMGHCTMPPSAPPPPCTAEHAAMGHCTLPETPATPGAGNAPPAPRVGAADAIFGADAMAAARARLYAEHGGGTISQLMVDMAEARIGKGGDSYAWDAEARFGGDIDKLAIKSEGEGDFGGRFDEAEVQALWSHAIGPYFDLQGGVRQDFGPGPSPTHAVLGFKGLAPYWFDVEGALFLSDKGDVTARIEGSYDQRITQRLIVQPMAEVEAAFQDIAGRGIGGGFSSIELGVRLRYEITREFAPYVGFAWERKLGKTARLARAAGEDASHPAFVAGIRFWF